MKKLILLTLLSGILSVPYSFSQTNPRMENPNYAQTIFFDDFDSAQLDRTVWNVSAHGQKDFYIWVDSVATVNQTNGDLNLSMRKHPNYTTVDYSNPPITLTANYIAGQIESRDYYSYGIYECNATFANQPGSFPAFWLMSGEPCNSSFNNEIDIVELKYDHSVPTLDNNIFYYPMICGTSQTSYEFTQNNFTWGGAHKYKCIWTPSKLEFWVDNTKLKEVKNTGQFWYPQLQQRIILSQQIWLYDDSLDDIVVPQTSNFHWVKVKKFFLAPEITCPTIICSSDTATMDLDPAATNISWALTPSLFFNGATTGTGATANITASPIYHGKGKITYTFNMPSGETFTAEKEVWIKGPDVSEVSFDVYRSDGVHATNMYGTWIICIVVLAYFNQ